MRVALIGSFLSQIETGPILTRSPSHESYTVPNVESQVFTPNVIPASSGIDLKATACQAAVLTTALPRPSSSPPRQDVTIPNAT